ncbi:hypothetical protein K9K77_02670 [Candidatus Babeliales bacterium]|nr:hypothetical protein [Candidatus Babeliales bacterium]
MVTNKKRLLVLLLGIGSIGSLCAMDYDFAYEASEYEEPLADNAYEAPVSSGHGAAAATAGPAAAAAAVVEVVEFLDEPKILGLDSDLTFLSVHCGGHPMAHLDTAISSVDFPKYVKLLEGLHKHFSEVVIITRGIKSETEEFLRAKNLLRPGLIDRVYGARDQDELGQSGTTYWPARKVTFLEELMQEKNIKSKASMYFYDDEKANVEMAGQKGFVNAYQAYADNPRNRELPYKRFRRGNGVALLQDILEDMETNCAICMAPLSENERFGNTACCKKDLLHKNCLEEWTMHKRSAECPLCRGMYTTSTDYHLGSRHYPAYHGREGYEEPVDYAEPVAASVAGSAPVYGYTEIVDDFADVVQAYEEPVDYAEPVAASLINVRPDEPSQGNWHDGRSGENYEDPLDNPYEEPLNDFDYAAPVATSAAVQAHSYEEPVADLFGSYEVEEDNLYEEVPVAASAAVQAQVPVAEVDSNVNEGAEAASGAYENIADVPDEYQRTISYTPEEQAFFDSIRSRRNAANKERDRKRAEDELTQARGRKAPVALPRPDRRLVVPAAAGEDSDLNRALEFSRQDQQRLEQQAQREEEEIQEAIQRSLEDTVRRSSGRTHSRTLGSVNPNSGL